MGEKKGAQHNISAVNKVYALAGRRHMYLNMNNEEN